MKHIEVINLRKGWVVHTRWRAGMGTLEKWCVTFQLVPGTFLLMLMVSREGILDAMRTASEQLSGLSRGDR